MWSRRQLTIRLMGLAVLPGAMGQGLAPPLPQPTGQHAASMRQASSTRDCARCHSCERPTPANRCLLFACTRGRRGSRAIFVPGAQGPDVVILDELEDAYLPVPFDHKGHAEMAEMASGCATCHHYTPRGQQHPPCKACHDVSADEANIDKPALRGAYHQQCLNCHREWINERDCDACHLAKAGSREGSSATVPVTTDDLMGRMHPPIPEPEGELYRSGSQRLPGWQVVFRHREHAHRFGLRCVECHHEPSCARCHTRDREQMQLRRPRDAHGPCIRCHKRDMNLAARAAGRCERCHWPEDQPKPDSFDHGSTGWLLGGFHEDKSCRDCHRQVPFEWLSSNCNDCHGTWSPSTFDHRVTGQTLDENHVDEQCGVCHRERRFDRPPTCDECHDPEDDGIVFPDARPGE
ncbi:MAG: cytochrome c3 family protein [Phycisphaerales bacterium]|nr:MAG: cytochrome c3 family protein [Phycisphaerales bacterium]